MGSWLIIAVKRVSFFICYKSICPAEMLLCEEYFLMLEFDKQVKFQMRFEVHIAEKIWFSYVLTWCSRFY